MEILEHVFAAHPGQKAAQVVDLRVCCGHGRRVVVAGQGQWAIHAPARSQCFRP